MIVKDYLSEKIAKGTIHMSLLDPDKQEPAKAGEIARKMKDAGSDAVMIGGSTGVTAENLAATAKAIREASGLPTILFPSGPAALSNEVDAMFFMSLMNSSDLSMVMGAQVYGAPIIKKLGIETIPMGYVVVEPGMKVGEVGKAMLVKRNEVEKAVAYGLACEMMGMSYFYLEAGSGAPEHVPVEMIKAVKSVLSIPLIIGGGIRTPEAAKAIREAGADAIVTGTFIEQCEDNSKLTAVVKAAKGL
jgi:phosphoglycerol geranylgeranyltransferase